MESAYNRKEKHEKSMCKHCKSEAHSTLEHRKHYKNFRAEVKEGLEKKHMKMFGSEEKEKPMKGLPNTFAGKSTKPGMGGRAAILKSEGVPGGVIGAIARSKGEAPGQAGFHKGKGKHMKGMADSPSMRGYDPNLGLGNKGYAKVANSRSSSNSSFNAVNRSVQNNPNQYGSGMSVDPIRTTAGNNASQTTPINNAALGNNFATNLKKSIPKKKA